MQRSWKRQGAMPWNAGSHICPLQCRCYFQGCMKKSRESPLYEQIRDSRRDAAVAAAAASKHHRRSR